MKACWKIKKKIPWSIICALFKWYHLQTNCYNFLTSYVLIEMFAQCILLIYTQRTWDKTNNINSLFWLISWHFDINYQFSRIEIVLYNSYTTLELAACIQTCYNLVVFWVLTYQGIVSSNIPKTGIRKIRCSLPFTNYSSIPE